MEDLFEGMNAVPLMLKAPNQGVLPRLEHLISSLAPPTLNCIFPTFDTLRAFMSAGKDDSSKQLLRVC